jgi:hypothetical protein
MHNSMHPNDAARFDRLVDGEMSEEERKNLLASLDNEPGGWRHCALAFLEAQCWKDTLGGLAANAMEQAETTTLPSVSPLSSLGRRGRTHWSVHLRTAMAMAACFLAALLLGSLLPRGRFSPVTGPSASDTANQVASNNPDAATSTQKIPANRSDSLTGRSGRSANPADALASQTPVGKAGVDGPWRMVTLGPSDGQETAAGLRLPAVERQNVDEAWLRNMPSAIPDEVLQALNRTGHQVQQRRELVPVPMKDGRRLVVPVDQVDVHYIGNGPY